MNDLLQIENRKGKVKLNESVYKDSADKLIDDLEKLYGFKAVEMHMKIGEMVCAADDALEQLEVEINSPGGSVFEGMRIYNSLRGISQRGVEVTAIVNGLAASMGSVILMAGDKRYMTKGSRIMIHEASTMAAGDARALKRQADLLESVSSEISAIYSERTGGDQKAIRDLMLAETWMDTDKAISMKFIDGVFDYKKDKGAKNESGQFDIQNEKSEKPTMSILSKLFPNNSEVEKLEAHIAENDSIRAELVSAQDRITELEASIESHATVSNELVVANSKIAEIEAIVTAKDEQITELNAKLIEAESKVKDADESASAKAVEMLATIGQEEPLEIQDSAISEGVKTRAEFNAMKPSARMAFVKAGGKIK